MCPAPHRKPYPSDVSDEEWSLVVPYLTLMTEAAPQRDYALRELFNALRYVIRYGIAWRAMPNDFPPWAAVYQQSQRWMAAECFEALAQDLRALLRLASGRAEEPTAAIIDSRTLRSTPESGTRAGYDGAKRKRGSKVHMAVDTLGHLLALHVTPADVGDRTAVKRLAPTSKMRPATASSWPTSTKATPVRRPPVPQRPRALRCTSSSCPKQSEVRAAAAALGGGTVLRVGHPLPPVGQGLRALRGNPRWLPRRRVRRIHAQAGRKPDAKYITPSSLFDIHARRICHVSNRLNHVPRRPWRRRRWPLGIAPKISPVVAILGIFLAASAIGFAAMILRLIR